MKKRFNININSMGKDCIYDSKNLNSIDIDRVESNEYDYTIRIFNLWSLLDVFNEMEERISKLESKEIVSETQEVQ